MLDKRVRKIPLHGLRHTAATPALLNGIPAKVISERLGHSSVAVTLNVYSHVISDGQPTDKKKPRTTGASLK
ncbi:MAG: tyrosine-type recombinase/integrase [Thermoleophilia bacterium]|nr:tyrosine-type recombinase/integrase [Thermoleophilia bacterium]